MSRLVLSRQQVREVDRLAIQHYGMSGLVLMENAGRGCVDVLEQLGIQGPVVVCCGRGNNAGDGFVIARHLEIRDYQVRLVLCSPPEQLRGDAEQNYRLVRNCSSPLGELAEPFQAEQLERLLDGADWIVDALLGTGAVGEPRAPYHQVLNVLNRHPARKLAVDVPSGLDCDTGQPARCTFRADHTCTFVASKPGYATERAAGYVGQVHVLDIGVPRAWIDRVRQGIGPA